MTKKEIKRAKVALGKIFRCPTCKKLKSCLSFYDWTKAGNQTCKACSRKKRKEAGYKKRRKGVPWYLNLSKEDRAKYAKKRYLAKKRATPVWSEVTEIKMLYEEARAKGKHVDHIIPLQGDLVCGLHVYGNLQLLSSKENRRKGNYFKAGS